MESDQPRALLAVGLYHDLPRNIIICMQHGFALAPKAIILHLRQKHRCKGEKLSAIQEYLIAFQDSIRGPQDCQQPSHYSERIPYITVVRGFACSIPTCSRGGRWLSANKRTVEKHVAREHGLPDRRSSKGKLHAEQHTSRIASVEFQSIFPRPTYQPFIVKTVEEEERGKQVEETTCSQGQHEGKEEQDIPSSQIIFEHFAKSQAQEMTRLHTVSSKIHKSQVPPWLRTTGVAEWLGGYDKEYIAALVSGSVADEDCGVNCIQTAVYECMQAASLMIQVGSHGRRFSRIVGRILNSFEPDRMQARPFHPVQEDSTLRRYSRSWGQLLVCLLRMRSTAYWDSVVESWGWPVGLEINEEVESVRRQASQLHAQEFGDSEKIERMQLDLQQAVQRLSCSLTRSTSTEGPFLSPVIQYCAFRTVEEAGGWVLASAFAPFLSGMIHSMQLWIAVWCMQSTPRSAHVDALEQCVKRECQSFLVNTSHSPVAELSFWRLLCWKVSDDTVLHPITTINEEASTVTHLHISLSFDAWRAALQGVLGDAGNILHAELFLGLRGAPRVTGSNLYDNPSNLTPGFSFIDDPRNNLLHAGKWLVEQLLQSPELTKRFITRRDCRKRSTSESCSIAGSPNGTACGDGSQSASATLATALLNPEAVESYLAANRRFLKLLAVLMYMTAGLPPRREELVSITWRNWEIARNVYVSDGLVVLVTGYHKSQWRVGNRPVARFLPHAVGNLLLLYLVYITPFLQFARHSIQLEPAQGFLFTEGGAAPWSPNRISDCMRQQTVQHLGFPITTRQWRHIAIAIDRRVLQSEGCRAYVIKESFGRRPIRDAAASDSDLDGDPLAEGNEGGLHGVNLDETASHLQAAHTARTGNMVYGNNHSLLFGLTDYLLASFRRVSRRWHVFTGLDDGSEDTPTQTTASRLRALFEGSAAQSEPSTLQPSGQDTQYSSASSHKRKASTTITGPPLPERVRAVRAGSPAMHPVDTAGSQLEVRAALWTWPSVERALVRLFGPHADLKSSVQRETLQLVVSSPPEALVILPTGGGKSLLYVLPTLLPGAQVTVVITPLVALQQDLTQRCTQWNISFGIYSSRSVLLPVAAQPSLLMIDAERASGPGFQTLLSELHAAGRLDRIVLDEAHLVLTASYYREQLPALAVLQRYRCPFICLTATLPPTAEREFRRLLCLSPGLERLRASSDRPNLSYRVQHLDAPSGLHADQRTAKHAQLVDAATQTLGMLVQQYGSDQSARFICYVRQKAVGAAIADELGCHFYHATLDGREHSVTAWRLGTGSPVIVATTALGAGIDYPSVRAVVHADAPGGILDYAQETGRAGRDGLYAACIVLLPTGWRVDWNRGFRSDFLAEDALQMTRLLEPRASTCLRMQLTRILDGGDGVACDTVSSRELCSYCMQHDGFSSPGDSDRGGLSARSQDADGLHAVSRSETASSDGSSDDDSTVHAGYLEPAGSSKAEQYSVSQAIPRLHAMNSAAALALYVERVGRWAPACIPCSFTQGWPVFGSHADCTQEMDEVRRLRMGIQFARYIGCWKCGQPAIICDSRQGVACTRSLLIFSVCWFALSRDARAAVDMLHAAGAPVHPTALASTAPQRLHEDAAILRWLGMKSTLHGQEASNAARFTHLWLDRLHAVCQ